MSAAPVFSAASIAGCIFTVLVSIALPVAALAVLKRKTGRGLLAALRGGECGDSALGVVQLGLRDARIMLRVLERTLGFVHGNDRQTLPKGACLGIG